MSEKELLGVPVVRQATKKQEAQVSRRMNIDSDNRINNIFLRNRKYESLMKTKKCDRSMGVTSKRLSSS